MSSSEVDCQIPADHPALPGHFPGQPLAPGALLLSLVHQQAKIQLGFPAGGAVWRRVKFLRPVLPEQPFRLYLEGSDGEFTFIITDQAGDIIAKGQCRHDSLV
jgi:3-hydroxymyristoyl/3-hydroxydecanoyl-(acyl carrier protein) dehydratase